MSMISLPPSADQPTLVHGDCLETLGSLPSSSVDVVITDPPAGISMMGRTWDSFAGYEPVTERGREVDAMLGKDDLARRAAELLHGLALSERTAGLPVQTEALAVAEAMLARAELRPALPAWARGFVVFMADVWSEVDRVLKPGGIVCAWALPKTADLAGLAMRLVGWTPVDSCLHLFSQGMAKNGDLGKKVDAIMGLERESVGGYRRPDGTSRHYEQWGAKEGTPAYGDMDIDRSITAPASELAALWTGTSTQLSPGWEQWQIAVKSVDAIAPAQLREIIGDHMWTYRKLDTPKKRKAAAAKWGREIPDGAREWRARPLAPEIDGRLELRVDGEVVATMPGPAYSKAPIRSAVANLLVHGCGAFNVDACRIPTSDDCSRKPSLVNGSAGFGQGLMMGGQGHPGGRLPKNVILTTGGPDCPAAELDRQSGTLTTNPGKCAADSTGGIFGVTRRAGTIVSHGDSGGASRFFTRLEPRIGYHPKVRDRSAGLRSDIRNGHPTVKSEALADWLVRLLARPGCVMLDPFMGSGTFGVSAVRARVRFIGIERDPVTPECHDSFGVARARIMAAIGSPEVAAEANASAPTGAQLSLV